MLNITGMNPIERLQSGLSKLTSRKSTKDMSALSSISNKDWPLDPNSYDLLDDCGRGVSATVHRSLCKPLNEIIAIKKMNLESMNCDLDEIIHEAQTMRQYSHPNVLPLYCSFVAGQDLWMVMPFVAGGSVLHIMKYNYPEGLDEIVIATIMRDVLKALEYVHKQGSIHRDVKAGNILVDKDGAVKLADFGVAATMERGASWGHDKMSRMTFVGTPCWMAPEVMEQTEGYDFSADIWSFGITLLEMAYGCAPFAKFPPMKVLLMTLQNPPPTLDDKGTKHFSKNMRDLVTRCLQKEPQKRPTATQLLDHKFFKQGKDDEYLGRNLMANLPSLAERVTLIRQGKAATSADINDRNLAKSQEEYVKGVSSWNFDVSALKAAAAMEPDDAGLPTISETEEGELLQTLTSVSVSALFSSQSPPSTAQFLPPPPQLASFNNTYSVMQSPATAAAALGATYISPIPAYVSFPCSGEGTPVRSTTPSLPDGPVTQLQPTPSFTSAFANIANSQIQYQLPFSGSSIAASAAARTSVSSGPFHESSFGASSYLPAGISIPELGQQDFCQPSANGRSSTTGALFADAPMSPSTTEGRGSSSSPATMSREGSVLTNTLSAIATTPTAVTKQKKGRFNVYEHGEVVPPMSPPNPHPALMEAFATMARPEHALSNLGVPHPPPGPAPTPVVTCTSFTTRASEDGFGRSASQPNSMNAQRSVLDATPAGSNLAADLNGMSSNNSSRDFEESVTSVETKRGRFKIVSDSAEVGSKSMNKVSSMLSLDSAGFKSRSDGGMAPPAGGLTARPPPAPSSLVTLPVTVILPKLQELMDHASAHQAAIMLSHMATLLIAHLQRLMGAVQDAERGKSPLLLSRNQSGRVPLFERTETDVVDEMRAQMSEMKARMSILEDDNRTLRSRNAMLESAIIHNRGQPANLLLPPRNGTGAPHPADLALGLTHAAAAAAAADGSSGNYSHSSSHPRQHQQQQQQQPDSRDSRNASTTQVSYLEVEPVSHNSTDHTPTPSGRASPHGGRASPHGGTGAGADYETLSMQRTGSGHGSSSGSVPQAKQDTPEEWVGQQMAMQHEVTAPK